MNGTVVYLQEGDLSTCLRKVFCNMQGLLKKFLSNNKLG